MSVWPAIPLRFATGLWVGLLITGPGPALAQGAPDDPPAMQVEGGSTVVRPDADDEPRMPTLGGRHLGGARLVIPREKLEGSGKTVADVLEEVPGLVLTRSGDGMGRTQVSIRGSQADQVLILLDGQPYQSSMRAGASARAGGLAGADLAAIPTESIESIEVIRGAAAGLHGPGAAAGVIRITTHAARAGRTEAELGVGSWGRRSARALHAWQAGEGRMQAGADFRSSDGVYAYYDPTANTANNPCTRDLGGGYVERRCNYREAAGLHLNWRGTGREAGDLRLERTLAEGLGGVADPRPHGREEGRRLQGGYSGEYRLEEGGREGGAAEQSLLWSVRGNHLDSRRVDVTTAPATAGIQDYDETALTGNLHWEEWEGVRRIKTGLSAQRERLRVFDAGTQPAFVAQRGLFSADALWEHQGQAGVVEGAARVDRYTASVPRGTYRVAATRALWGSAGVKASHGTGYRQPGFHELYAPGAVPGSSAANPDLRPEDTRSADGGLFAEVGAWLYAESLWFRQDYRDHIVSVCEATCQFQNLGRTRTEGTESTLNLRPWKALALDLAHTVQQAVILRDNTGLGGEGHTVPGVPERYWSASLEWRGETWRVRGQSRHKARRYVDQLNTIYLKAYTVHDVGVSLRLGAWRARLDVTNLGNESYLELDNHPPPGRGLMLTVLWGHPPAGAPGAEGSLP